MALHGLQAAGSETNHANIHRVFTMFLPPCLHFTGGLRLQGLYVAINQYFHSLSLITHSDLQDITLAVCQCQPAVTQLIQHGVFPCVPVWPSLAVSLDMLEFVAELFVHITPNEREWAAMLEKYLSVHGYQLAAKDSVLSVRECPISLPDAGLPC
jgi:CxC1 like cysteine cluster associated with KDZ transposases